MTIANEVAKSVGTKLALGVVGLVAAYFAYRYVKGEISEAVSSISTAVGDAAKAVVAAPGKAVSAVVDSSKLTASGSIGVPSYASGIDLLNNPFSTKKSSNTALGDNANSEWRFYEQKPFTFTTDADEYTKKVLSETLPSLYKY